MALYRIFTSIFFFFSLTLFTPTIHSLNEPDPDSISTVYELLPKYGLPSGLLPDNVTNFTLSDDGRFVVHLPDSCEIEFDYLVRYDKTISGRIGYGSITELKGIEVRRFFIWLDVDEIKVDLPPSDSIYFKVGFINKKLDIDQFKTVRSCHDNGVSGSSCGDSWKSFLEKGKILGMMDEAEMLITE
ncbi:PREDICTED: uncharacterized protein LOC104736054 [Camelina sativa]|uniref:Uncharacterized protein LOC104736054 n=1 Tax=Camelina sativa TaxID=90675 RepID=A0ABM0VCT7_CAMSA|nr:PREDICTED: uncharacterized protein LOC104736054 [Camelina sativa]